MKGSRKLLAFISLFSAVLLSGCENNLVVFQPGGPAARSILDLINFSIVMMLAIIIVVFALFGYIVWKYRERKDTKDYEPPEEHGNTALEIIWTIIPIIIVIALTIPTVKTIYALDKVPKGYEKKEPLVINVTSADWKWIFSYPEQGIETVNYVNIPEDRPIDFRLTSASTMQSFWIPSLAGQKYSMANAETQLYLVADKPGSYMGRNTNFNGKGYAEMEFEVLAQTHKDFEEWIEEVKETAPKLTEKKYEKMLEPSHLGRETFSNTHLEWVDHSKGQSEKYIKPELYKREHGYQGKIFKEDHSKSNHDQHEMDKMNENHGGGHSGH
ncbi:cytochrome aa3 quinol oxidase subunit II [Bacillus massilinigeriensis]|uniref:cytochrome aa3 quinol oxidase subunit II n=1 Tax=Bacillus mediterraneensis TaxID=1805474 RepID=UPI0008F832E7|nr:cytochrome aa3 quinol oxidase subunit II [Bacillus mediterraneensis]